MIEEELPAHFADLNTESEVPTSCVLSSLAVVVHLRYLRICGRYSGEAKHFSTGDERGDHCAAKPPVTERRVMALGVELMRIDFPWPLGIDDRYIGDRSWSERSTGE